MEIESLEWAVVFFGAVSVAHLYAIWSLINKSTKLLTAIQKDLRLCLMTYFDGDDQPLGITTLQTLASRLYEIERHTSIISERVRASKF